MVIGITDKTHCQTLWNKGTKRLTAAAFAVDGICIIFKCIAESIGNDRAKNRTGCTVHRRYMDVDTVWFMLGKCLFKGRQKHLFINCILQMECIVRITFMVSDLCGCIVWVDKR